MLCDLWLYYCSNGITRHAEKDEHPLANFQSDSTHHMVQTYCIYIIMVCVARVPVLVLYGAHTIWASKITIIIGLYRSSGSHWTRHSRQCSFSSSAVRSFVNLIYRESVCNKVSEQFIEKYSCVIIYSFLTSQFTN